MSEIVADVLPALLDDVSEHGRPYGLFGHSFGALVAFEIARALAFEDCRQPTHLWASAFASPDRIPDSYDVGALRDEELLQHLDDRFGGIPSEVREHPELSSIVAGFVRSDYQALVGYVPPTRKPLPLDVTAYHGESDRAFPDDATGWQAWCGGAFTSRVLPGDHFYVNDTENALILAHEVAGVLGEGAVSP